MFKGGTDCAVRAEIGKKVKARLKEKGMTQESLASKLGKSWRCSPPQISLELSARLWHTEDVLRSLMELAGHA